MLLDVLRCLPTAFDAFETITLSQKDVCAHHALLRLLRLLRCGIERRRRSFRRVTSLRLGPRLDPRAKVGARIGREKVNGTSRYHHVTCYSDVIPGAHNGRPPPKLASQALGPLELVPNKVPLLLWRHRRIVKARNDRVEDPPDRFCGTGTVYSYQRHVSRALPV